MVEGQDISILLVEDDELDRENLQRAFQKTQMPYSVHIAKDGYEAYGMLTGKYGFEQLSSLPEILLFDINMPRMNGLELLRKIREQAALHTISAFILTTSDSEQDILAAYDLHVAGYMVKPMKIDAYMKTITILVAYWSQQHFPKQI